MVDMQWRTVLTAAKPQFATQLIPKSVSFVEAKFFLLETDRIFAIRIVNRPTDYSRAIDVTVHVDGRQVAVLDVLKKKYDIRVDDFSCQTKNDNKCNSYNGHQPMRIPERGGGYRCCFHTFEEDSTNTFDHASFNSNWMGVLLHRHPGYDIKLTDLVMPLTHDSGTVSGTKYFDDSLLPFHPYLGHCGGRESWATTQRLPISAQLKHGVRAFDIRAKCWPDDDEVIWNQHGDCDMDKTLVASLGEIGIFLDNHPSEVVVVFLSQADMEKNRDLCWSALKDTVEHHVGRHVFRRGFINSNWNSDTILDLPSLGDAVQRNKRLFIVTPGFVSWTQFSHKGTGDFAYYQGADSTRWAKPKDEDEYRVVEPWARLARTHSKFGDSSKMRWFVDDPNYKSSHIRIFDHYAFSLGTPPLQPYVWFVEKGYADKVILYRRLNIAGHDTPPANFLAIDFAGVSAVNRLNKRNPPLLTEILRVNRNAMDQFKFQRTFARKSVGSSVAPKSLWAIAGAGGIIFIAGLAKVVVSRRHATVSSELSSFTSDEKLSAENPKFDAENLKFETDANEQIETATEIP